MYIVPLSCHGVNRENVDRNKIIIMKGLECCLRVGGKFCFKSAGNGKKTTTEKFIHTHTGTHRHIHTEAHPQWAVIKA